MKAIRAQTDLGKEEQSSLLEQYLIISSHFQKEVHIADACLQHLDS